MAMTEDRDDHDNKNYNNGGNDDGYCMRSNMQVKLSQFRVECLNGPPIISGAHKFITESPVSLVLIAV